MRAVLAKINNKTVECETICFGFEIGKVLWCIHSERTISKEQWGMFYVSRAFYRL